MDAESIFKKLSELEALQKKTLDALSNKEAAPKSLGTLIDPLELAKKLKVTMRTLRRYKTSGMLVPCTIGSREYYFEEDIIAIMRSSRSRYR